MDMRRDLEEKIATALTEPVADQGQATVLTEPVADHGDDGVARKVARTDPGKALEFFEK